MVWTSSNNLEALDLSSDLCCRSLLRGSYAFYPDRPPLPDLGLVLIFRRFSPLLTLPPHSGLGAGPLELSLQANL